VSEVRASKGNSSSANGDCSPLVSVSVSEGNEVEGVGIGDRSDSGVKDKGGGLFELPDAEGSGVSIVCCWLLPLRIFVLRRVRSPIRTDEGIKDRAVW
jgi:hypothetical protein